MSSSPYQQIAAPMIPRSTAGWQRPAWQTELGKAITSPAELLERLDLDPGLLTDAELAGRAFPLCVPRGFVRRMERGNPDDPLLRQVLPQAVELTPQPTGFSSDPVGDLDAATHPGVLHKYHGRALVIATGACAIHCRYCFRRHFPYGKHTGADHAWSATLSHLRANATIDEVILSGGDPLLLADERLNALLRAIEAIPHVRRLRIHTRLPVVLPERVTPSLVQMLEETRFRNPVIVLHTNHANEIDAAVAHACSTLKTAGTVLLNQ
ncbi:MAG TPA: KamA family radical SAM protein, partial [Chromatiales bacterium]|nr:KamA family radical SAM protein [Chromatiales bacterium]